MPGLSDLGQDLRHAARPFWRQPVRELNLPNPIVALTRDEWNVRK